MDTRTPRALLLYHRPVGVKDASTVREHIDSFLEFSEYAFVGLNTGLGFPRWLVKYRFPLIVLHYSLFGSARYPMEQRFVDYIDACTSSFKVAFFQDEYYFCPKRYDFIRDHGIDCIFTLLEEQYHDIYRARTGVESLYHTLTGYVGPQLIRKANRFAREDDHRNVDVFYRGRELPPYTGRAAQEKVFIAKEFKRRASGLGLDLDIETRESKRLYGDDWYRSLGNSKATLGVEAGVSVFDLDGVVYDEYLRLAEEHPRSSCREMLDRLAPVMDPWENRVFYRTISPRHFEASAFRNAQILFEGHYNGILEPGVHYISLQKDFSNFEDVIRQFRDGTRRQEVTERAYADLIESGAYTYEQFIQGFDRVIESHGIAPWSHRMAGGALLGVRSRRIDAHFRILAIAAARRSWRLLARFLRTPAGQALWTVLRPIVKPLVNRIRARRRLKSV